MLHIRCLRRLGLFVLLTVLGYANASAQQVKTVFVIAMENHNWTQPANQFTGPIQQIYQNPNAPFINSLVNGTAPNGISGQVAYATAYHNALATPTGPARVFILPSPTTSGRKPVPILGFLTTTIPSRTPPNSQNTSLHLTALLTNAGKTWRSYQEDIDLTPDGLTLDNVPLPETDWTVPLKSFSGFFASGVNAYNGSKQYNYAAKHNPMVFFDDTNGGNNTTTSNPLRTQYAPLQQLAADLASDNVADYNWITPDQYNDIQ